MTTDAGGPQFIFPARNDKMAANISNGTDATVPSVLNADQIANLSITIFFCFFLCFVGYALYWCQNTKERMEKTRLALERNREINKHMKKVQERSVRPQPHSEAGLSKGSQDEVEEKSDGESASPMYNDQVHATVAPPMYSPLQET